ncbi:MAG: hypothetical protein LBR78_01490 [Holosporales bacterium]|jgi:hypothetical protein|nr:hypothetical protein [Holosporales bacterium]
MVGGASKEQATWHQLAIRHAREQEPHTWITEYHGMGAVRATDNMTLPAYTHDSWYEITISSTNWTSLGITKVHMNLAGVSMECKIETPDGTRYTRMAAPIRDWLLSEVELPGDVGVVGRPYDMEYHAIIGTYTAPTAPPSA